MVNVSFFILKNSQCFRNWRSTLVVIIESEYILYVYKNNDERNNIAVSLVRVWFTFKVTETRARSALWFVGSFEPANQNAERALV